jgi:hypothetical protein
MCGLAGVMSTSLNNHEIESFQQLMTLSTLRGRWGSGLAMLDQKNKIHTMKSLSTGVNLVYGQPFFDKVKAVPSLKMIVGHTRWPTKGASDNLDFIHPHEHGHIIGCHNGTMTRVADHYLKEGESDSSLLIKSIAEHGIQETLDTSWGAYALTWFDTQAKTLNFLRNSERPLYIGHPESSMATVFWASEEDFLTFVLRRRYVGNIKTEQLPVNTLLSYSMKLGGKIAPITAIEMKPHVKVYKGTWDSHFKGDDLDGLPFGHSGVACTISRRGEKPKIINNSDKNLDDAFETEKNYFVPKFHLFRILQTVGCSWCAAKMSIAEYHQGKCLWISPHEFLCDTCTGDDEIHRAAIIDGVITNKGNLQ